MMNSNESSIHLRRLFPQLPPQDFFSRYWERQHLVSVVNEEDMPGFAKVLGGLTTRELVRFATDPVIVMHSTTAGQYRGSRVYASDAIHFLEAGNALYFNLLTSFSDVKSWRESLADELGQPPARCHVSLFITPPNWVTELHFDPNENFTLQLKGKKTWRIGANEAIESPVHRFSSSLPIPESMRHYFPQTAQVPTTLSSSEFVGPNSVLYVPRGFWHSVESIDEAISINFAVNPLTWAEMLLPIINRSLQKDPAMRASTRLGARFKPIRDLDRSDIAQKLALLQALVAQLRPDQVVSGQESDGA